MILCTPEVAMIVERDCCSCRGRRWSGAYFVPLSLMLLEQPLEKPIIKRGISRAQESRSRCPNSGRFLHSLVKMGREAVRQLESWLNRRVICRHDTSCQIVSQIWNQIKYVPCMYERVLGCHNYMYVPFHSYIKRSLSFNFPALSIRC